MASDPEILLISSILNTQDHVIPTANGITADYFHIYFDEYSWIERYIKLHRRTPSKAAFRSKFPETRLISRTTDVTHFCQEVKESNAQSEVLGAVNDVVALVKKGDLRAAISMLQESATRASTAYEGDAGNVDIINDWQDSFNEANVRFERTKQFGQSGVPTGFPTLDERTGGPQPGQFWVIAARLGEGKTWTLNRMATAALFSGITVQYDALEMTRAEIAWRVHTFASSKYGQQVFKNLDISQGQDYDPKEYMEFLRDLGKQIKAKFFVADQSRGPITLSTMASQIERNKPGALYLDYITLLENENPDMRVGITKLSAGLKNLGNRYGVPVIVAAQLNRGAAGRRDLPGPEDLAESDSIGRDADVVVTMRQMSKRVIAMKLAKNRHGQSGFIWYCKFLPNTGHFQEITFEEAQDVMQEDKDEREDQEPASVPKQRKTSGFEPVKKNEKAERNNTRRRIIRRSVQDS